MSQTPKDQNKEPTFPSPSDASLPQGTMTLSAPAKEAVAPTLSAYFGVAKVSARAFFKALKTAKVKQFAEGDEAQATEMMVANDPDGQRLWSLMSQATMPDAVDRWIWKTAQDRLKIEIGAEFDPTHPDASHIFNQLNDLVAPRIESKDKTAKKRAENWLRVGIRWLIEKRSLDPWQVAEKVRPTLFKRHADATKTAVRILQRGRPTEFRQAVAMASLAQKMVESAQRERDSERRASAGLQQKLTGALGEIDSLSSKIASLEDDLNSKSKSLASALSQMEAERQHSGHDISATKAEQKVLLQSKVKPLLSDAVDALEIEPPAPHVTLNRLKAAISIIDEATQ